MAPRNALGDLDDPVDPESTVKPLPGDDVGEGRADTFELALDGQWAR